ncbi:MAG: sigma-70 family RNA polymerase sigma factor [Acidobacteria bacterium]|nr:sigma-70 family RNA polymerase sigma factor [Acidobacteriota bacterium]
MADLAAVIRVEDVSAHTDAGARAELLSEAEFQDLYRTHGRALWAYLYRLTGNTADADDLLQEAYCRLLATPLATREDTQLRAYLFRVATNAATDLWRRGGRGSRRTEPLTNDVAAVRDHGDAVALSQDMARTFRELKPQERVLLWLAHVEGTGHAEIASTLGLKAASVPVLLFRARRKLADLIRKKGFGPGAR